MKKCKNYNKYKAIHAPTCGCDACAEKWSRCNPKSRMKKFSAKVVVNYEGYSGYDHDATFDFTNIFAINDDSAANKAKELMAKSGGGYLQRGYIKFVSVEAV